MSLANTAQDPYNYFLLLRALFRSIGGGSHDSLYQEFLPLLPNLLQGECLEQNVARKTPTVWGVFALVHAVKTHKGQSIDKKSTDLYCFIFQSWGLGALFGVDISTKVLVATGLVWYCGYVSCIYAASAARTHVSWTISWDKILLLVDFAFISKQISETVNERVKATTRWTHRNKSFAFRAIRYLLNMLPSMIY